MNACTACLSPVEEAPLETCREKAYGRVFELYACPACGVVFTKPQDDFPLVEWYEKASAMYGEVEYSVHAKAQDDLRFKWFLGLGLSGDLLDVGCGDGRFLAFARDQGWKGTLTGLDFNKEMARRSREGFSIVVEPLETFRGQYDVVVLFDVFEHFARPAETLGHLKALLKPGGRLVLTTPNAARLRLFTREEFDFPPHHFTRWTEKSLGGLVRRQGFVCESARATRAWPRDFSEQIFYQFFSAALSGAKRLVFGAEAAGKSVAELVAEGPQGTGRGRRKRIESALKTAFNVLTFPVFGILCLALALSGRRLGPGLFVAARLEG